MNVQKLILDFLAGCIPIMAAIYVAAGIRFLRHTGKNGNPYYPLLLFACAIFGVGYYLELKASTIVFKLAARTFGYLGVMLLPALGMLLTRRLVNKKPVPDFLQWALFSLSLGLWFLYLLNPVHGMFYKEVSLRSLGQYVMVYTPKGPFFQLLYTYFAVFLIDACFLLFKAQKKPEAKREKYIRLLAFFAVPIPCLVWLFLGLDRLIDPSPIFLLFLGTLCLFSEGKNDLLQTQFSRWEHMFLSAADPVFLFRKHSLMRQNPAAGALPGADVLPEDDILNMLENAVFSREPVGFPPGHASMWMDVRKSVFDMRSDLTNYQLIDITEKRLAFESLRAGEEQYRLLIAQMKQGLAVFKVIQDDLGKSPCLHSNAAFAQDIGQPMDAIVGRTLDSFFPDMDQEWHDAFGSVVAGGLAPRLERYLPWLNRFFGIRIYAPRPGELAVILSDITARKAVEKENAHRDMLLLAITTLTQDLLTAREYSQVLPKALNMVGEAMDVSRIYLFENVYNAGRIDAFDLRAEWSADADMLLNEESAVQRIPAANMEFILRSLQEGTPFEGDTAALNDSAVKRALAEQGVQSILALPVFVQGRHWGTMGFFECRRTRSWTNTEKNMLQLFVGSLSRAVERYENERKLREAQEWNNAILQAIPDLFFVFTPEGKIVHFHSSGALDAAHFAPEVYMNRLVSQVFPEQIADPFMAYLQEALRDSGVRVFEYEMKHQQDMTYFEARVLPINQDLVLVLARDITENRKRQEKIEYLSFHDQLTGLYNRRYYNHQIEVEDRPEKLPLALMLVDVNGLKLTNDAFGHQMGDLLLTKTAQILKSVLGEKDVARIGGDEFTVLLANTDLKKARELTAQVHQLIAEESNERLIFSVSIGVAVKRHASEDFREVFKQAEDDMYRHKLFEGLSMRSRAIGLIMKTLYEKSAQEMAHSKRVSELSEAIARNMALSEDTVNQVRMAGLMHDIGKIGMEDKVLGKTGRLDAKEWGQLKRHCEVGYRILSSVHEFSVLSQYVLEHHERWDGKGYPKGLKDEEITLPARIIAVADSFEAMVSIRTYKEPRSRQAALREIRRCAGTQFDPDVARVFVEKVMGESWEE